MYKRILVALGEQPSVSAAVEYGVALAAQVGAAVCFLNVLSLPLFAGTPDSVPCSTLVLDSLIAYSQRRLARALAVAAQEDVSASAIQQWGRTSATIAWIAAREDCDLLILGTPTAAGWRVPFRGQMAHRVAASARIPVLRVPPAHAPRHAGACWSRLLVCLDDSPATEAVLDYVLPLAQAACLDVRLLHVGAAWCPGAAKRAPNKTRAVCTLAAAACAAAGVRYDLEVASAPGVAALLTAATPQPGEVIVLGEYGRAPWSWLWCQGLTRAVLTRANAPVLLVPATLCLPAPVM